MTKGTRILLRPVQDDDWRIIEEWSRNREALWGLYQRFQLDHLPALREAYQRGRLLHRDSGLLLIETVEEKQVIGFVRYSMSKFPDADNPYPEIGFGIGDVSVRGRGLGREAVGLLVNYLFSGYPIERIAALTDVENLPAQKLLEGLDFEREGVLRRAMCRDGAWRDCAIYGILREELRSNAEL